MLEREWATLILDESHHLRCSKKRTEPKEVTWLFLSFGKNDNCFLYYTSSLLGYKSNAKSRRNGAILKFKTLYSGQINN